MLKSILENSRAVLYQWLICPTPSIRFGTSMRTNINDGQNPMNWIICSRILCSTKKKRKSTGNSCLNPFLLNNDLHFYRKQQFFSSLHLHDYFIKKSWKEKAHHSSGVLFLFNYSPWFNLRINSSMWFPYWTDSSLSKINSGVLYKVNRCPNSLRISPLALSKPCWAFVVRKLNQITSCNKSLLVVNHRSHEHL